MTNNPGSVSCGIAMAAVEHAKRMAFATDKSVESCIADEVTNFTAVLSMLWCSLATGRPAEDIINEMAKPADEGTYACEAQCTAIGEAIVAAASEAGHKIHDAVANQN